ncbi:hypothetical protein F5887DRAFT_952686 [Amanita rubescens]|nr:hypothetical protein F5887DRAFT_952686 [Amanita rubescens]
MPHVPRTIATTPPSSHSRRHAMSALPSDLETAVYQSLGAAFIGFAVTCCLYGALLRQILAYYLRFQQDKPLYKCLVAILGILGVLDQISSRMRCVDME